MYSVSALDNPILMEKLLRSGARRYFRQSTLPHFLGNHSAAIDDNIIGLPEDTTGLFVYKGLFIIATPLSVGEHTIHIQDEYAGSLNIIGTMILTVNP